MSVLVELPRELYALDAMDGFAAAGGFTLGTARAAAWLAQLAYESDPAKIADIATEWRLATVRPFQGTAATILPMASTRGLIVATESADLVIFAGTDPLVLANWVTDFDIRLAPDDIHTGFGIAAGVVWTDLRSLACSRPPGRPLILVGHSLGAALAVITALRMTGELGVVVDAIYTFGMPRAGGVSFSDGYDAALGQCTFRLVNGADLVPRIPPSTLGFRHVGRLLRCGGDGSFDAAALEAAPGSDEPAFAGSLLADLRSRFAASRATPPAGPVRSDALGRIIALLPPPIADHFPDRYCRGLGSG